MKEHQKTLNELKNGEKVYTNSGIVGVIKAIDAKENTIELEIAHGVVIKILKSSISDLVNKETGKYLAVTAEEIKEQARVAAKAPPAPR